MAGKGGKRRPEAERGLFDEGFVKLDWNNYKDGDDELDGQNYSVLHDGNADVLAASSGQDERSNGNAA